MFTTAWWFRSTLAPHRWSLALGALLVIMVAVLDVASPWPLKVVVDNVLDPKAKPESDPLLRALGVADFDRPGLIAFALAALLILTGLSALASYGSSRLLGAVGERVSAAIRERVFVHLQRMSLSFHNRQRLGDLLTRTTTDVDYVQSLLVSVLSVFVPNLMILVFIAVICFVVDPAFALIALAVGPLLFGVVLFYRRRIKASSRQARAKDSEIASTVSETFTAVRVMQSYTSEAHHARAFAERNSARRDAGLRLNLLQSTFSPLVDVIMGVGTALVMFVGIHRVLDQTMSLGLLLVFLTYLKSLYVPMKALAKLTTVISRGQASAERLNELLGTEPEIRDRIGAKKLHGVSGLVEFRNVHFEYDLDRAVLHDVNLRVAPGQMIAITGPTGAGKSSIIGLIPRLFDVSAGQVLVDGHDVRDLLIPSLRRRISVVQQDSVLFHGTIRDNIIYGAEKVSEKRFLAAARAAYVDEFVDRLPDGYETHVAERGVTLSGGQRQRIAIARAFLRNAPIVLLDEPTSGLDAQSEQYVMAGLDSLMKGRTVVVIAHRLSTLRKADQIYVIDEGRVVEQGTHAQLLRGDGLYAHLDRLQHGDGATDPVPDAEKVATGEPVAGDETATHAAEQAPDEVRPVQDDVPSAPDEVAARPRRSRRDLRADSGETSIPAATPIGAVPDRLAAKRTDRIPA